MYYDCKLKRYLHLIWFFSNLNIIAHFIFPISQAPYHQETQYAYWQQSKAGRINHSTGKTNFKNWNRLLLYANLKKNSFEKNLVLVPSKNLYWTFQLFSNAMVAAGLVEDPRTVVTHMNDLLTLALEKH
jgi:hypothetical protein